MLATCDINPNDTADQTTFTDFLLIAQQNVITRMDLKSDMVQVLPIPNLKTVAAVDYDTKRNCIFWSDIVTNIIARHCFDANEFEVLASIDIKYVNSLAYDWTSELLYFIDGGRWTIDVISTADRARASLNRMHRTVVDTGHESQPRALAIDPSHGFLFWAEYKYDKRAIYRANVDGNDVRVLVSGVYVEQPCSLAIDYAAKRIYWADVTRNYIGRCDFDGNRFEEVMKDDEWIGLLGGLAVYGQRIYWSDFFKKKIVYVNKGKSFAFKRSF